MLRAISSWCVRIGLILSATTPVHGGFVGIDPPPGFHETKATGLSADGSVVVGSYFDVLANVGYAYRWTAATGLQALGTLPNERQSHAMGVSGDGQVTVGFSVSNGNSDTACRWTPTQGIQPLAAQRANGVSADGSVAAGFANGHAVRITSSGVEDLGVLPGQNASVGLAISADGSTVVGWSQTQPFRWTAAGGMQRLGDFTGTAYAVSADGTVVVGESGSSNRAFRWSETGGMQLLPFGPGVGGRRAYGVSPDGNVIVGSGDTGAAIWNFSTGEVFDLRTLLLAQGYPVAGWSLREGVAVSGDASIGFNIVGLGFRPIDGQATAFLVTDLVVPEPAGAAALSLLSIVLCIKRRRSE